MDIAPNTALTLANRSVFPACCSATPLASTWTNRRRTRRAKSHKLNATYKFDDDKLVYFTYSTGYRPGGINRSGDFPPYQADHLDNYEVGWKTSWLDRSLNWNGRNSPLRRGVYSNFQFAFLGPNTGLTIIQNAPLGPHPRGRRRVWSGGSPRPWTLSGGGSYNDATLSSGNFCGTDQSTGLVIPQCSNSAALALDGQQLPYTPKFKGNVTARYTFGAWGWDAHAQVAVAFQTETQPALFIDDLANLGHMPGYATADFSFGAEKNQRSVELFLKNAFDTRGQLNRFTPCTTSVCAPSYPGVPAAVYVVPIQPLTVGIRIGQKF